MPGTAGPWRSKPTGGQQPSAPPARAIAITSIGTGTARIALIYFLAGVLKLLLEVCTVRSMDDPRAAAVTANLARASDQLATAAGRIDTLFAAGIDLQRDRNAR